MLGGDLVEIEDIDGPRRPVLNCPMRKFFQPLTVMLEYFLLLLLLLVPMAAKKSKRRRFNLRRVRVTTSPAVGALAADDVTSVAITAAVADKLRIMSLDATYSWSDIQQITDDGLTFGVAHSDYSAAEVEECLEANGSIDLGDKIAQEQANRLVRTIGTFSGLATAAGGGITFNDGKPVKTRLNWLLSEGDTLNMWFRNGSSLVYVTGSSVLVDGSLWVKD